MIYFIPKKKNNILSGKTPRHEKTWENYKEPHTQGNQNFIFEMRQNLILKEISEASPRIFTRGTARQMWRVASW